MTFSPTLKAGISALFLCLASFSSENSLASDLRPVSQLFEKLWQSGYQESRCGDNITGLVRAAIQRGISMQNAEVISITNPGLSMFGMVNAERTRNESPMKKISERNWGHHVILVVEGHVIDFDFMLEPTVLPVRDYFERMFLDEIPNPDQAFYKVGRNTKLRDYLVTLHPAREVAERPRTGIRKREVRLGAYLQAQ